MLESASAAPGADHDNDKIYAPRESWYPSDKDSNPFRNRSNGDKNSKKGRDIVSIRTAIPSEGLPSDSSNSDSDSDRKQPSKPKHAALPTKPLPAPEPNSNKGPHFDMKLKPESVPQWDRDVYTLARWVSKINQLSKASQAVHQEFGAIVPRRLMKTAETWYYSIPDRD